jgi:hypothetical protein
MSAFETLETVNRCRTSLKRSLGCIDSLTANNLARCLSHHSPTCVVANTQRLDRAEHDNSAVRSA